MPVLDVTSQITLWGSFGWATWAMVQANRQYRHFLERIEREEALQDRQEATRQRPVPVARTDGWPRATVRRPVPAGDLRAQLAAVRGDEDAELDLLERMGRLLGTPEEDGVHEDVDHTAGDWKPECDACSITHHLQISPTGLLLCRSCMVHDKAGHCGEVLDDENGRIWRCHLPRGHEHQPVPLQHEAAGGTAWAAGATW